MKKFLTFLCAVTLVLGMVGISAATSYTSTFTNVAGDFSLTGFSTPSTPPALPTATSGPDSLTITNPTGTYSLDVPPSGTYDWFAELNDLSVDFYGDPTPELVLGHTGPIFVGTYASPTPAYSGTYNFGDVYIPSYTDATTGATVGNYTLDNLNVGWVITPSGTSTGTMTDFTQIVLNISSDNLSTTLNKDLTNLDNAFGGHNGVIDGHVIQADFSVTATPEPSTILLIGIGLLGLVGYSRKRKEC